MLSKIESQAVDGAVAVRIFDDNDAEVFGFTLSPMDTVNVARTLMEKAADAVAQPEPIPAPEPIWRRLMHRKN